MKQDDWEAMARTVYGEARGQPYLGQVAVAWVIKNRADHPSWWGKSIQEVCLKPYQFSCWNEDDPNRAIIEAATVDSPGYLECLGVSALVMTYCLPDPTSGATHYYADSIAAPDWAASMIPTVAIGAHKFFRAD